MKCPDESDKDAQFVVLVTALVSFGVTRCTIQTIS